MVPLSELVTQHTDGGAAVGQPPGAVPLGHAELQPEGQCPARSGGRGDQPGHGSAARAADDPGELPGQCAGVPGLAVQHADPDPGGAHRGLYHPRHAVREHDPSADHHLDPAVGRRRRTAGAAAIRLRPGRDGNHRHHPADRHREKERHHAGGLRAGSRTTPGIDARAVDLRSVPAALPTDPDDHDVRAAWAACR